MTFGDLWRLIEKNRVSPDLRVVGYDGRFGLPENRITIYDGKEALVNVPYGAITIDKMIFKWDGNYTSANHKVRDVAIPAGTILKRLVKHGSIKADKKVKELIAKSLKIEKIEVYNEEDEVVAQARTIEGLRRQLDATLQRMHGLIPR